MTSVFKRATRGLALLTVLVLLMAPSAFATEPTADPSLWAEFTAWLEGRIGIPGAVEASETDSDSFAEWLMARIHIPGA
jgi:hypothetical protein